MQKEDIFIVICAIILISSITFVYKNMDSLQCFTETSTKTAMSDIKYEFEPEGSLYGKTKIYRFNIVSSANNLEYYSMKVLSGNKTSILPSRHRPRRRLDSRVARDK